MLNMQEFYIAVDKREKKGNLCSKKTDIINGYSNLNFLEGIDVPLNVRSFLSKYIPL